MRSTGSVAVAAAVITLAFAVGACGEKSSDTNAGTPANSTPIAPVTTTAASNPTQPVQANKWETFGSPTGNIACQISAGFDTTPASVRCELLQISFTPPPFPARCYQDGEPVPGSRLYGRVVYFSTEEKPGFTCGASDTIGGAANMKVLEYGSSTTFAGFTCTSTPAGIRCERGAQYFRIASDSYEFG
ncbi:hypothetical protein ACWDOP_03365 [Nocardia sp. NPDC003693]